MRKLPMTLASLTLLVGAFSHAQPPGITMDMINTTLPLEGAPLAEVGPYAVESGTAFSSPGHQVYHPAAPGSLPAGDTLPLLVWGNGGCAIDGSRYAGFLGNIASHGFVVMTTAAIEGAAPRQANADDLLAAIDWAIAENGRAGSPLNGKINTSQIAVMGQSCGGFLSVSLGTDPRVGTIGVFNSGVQAPNPNAPAGPFPTTDSLAKLHGPVMFINGSERDFMQDASHANFELVNHVPAFYGARHGAGHTATVYHPGGGEFANVVTHWLKYQFRHDAEAGLMFVGADCELCTNPNWDTDSKGLE